jgi:tripartite-type tricarboxylate transporter receptor subunit TctC
VDQTIKSVLFFCLVTASGALHAQNPVPGFPTKPITIILPSTAGGSGDVYSRIYTQVITRNTGWKFVVDYKPGAGSTLGTAYVAKSPPDGHTLLLIASTFTSTPLTYPDLPYDTIKSFAPVSLLGNQTNALISSAHLPATNLQEYVAFAKANPGKLNFGNNGIGGYAHLVGSALHYMMGIQVADITYKGGSQIANDLISGQIHSTMSGISGYMPFIKAGKLRLLGVTAIKRTPNLPDVPTLSEQGATGFDYSGWIGIIAPAATPRPTVMALNAEIVKATKDPELLEKLSPVTIVASSTPEEFRDLIIRQTNGWPKLVRDAHIKLTE